jgi:HSP20 family protein
MAQKGESKGEVTRAKEEQPVERVSPARALSPFEDMERMFEGFFPSAWMRPGRWDWPTWAERAMPFEGRMPKVDVVDREDEVVIRAELPGVDKKDLDVSMTDNTVTIKGSTRKEEKEEKGDYYRCEISSGSFSRTVTLPAQVDAGKSSAKFKDGVLELKVPKKERAKRRSIKVE